MNTVGRRRMEAREGRRRKTESYTHKYTHTHTHKYTHTHTHTHRNSLVQSALTLGTQETACTSQTPPPTPPDCEVVSCP